ncbi:hypothetical protein APHAL10511_008200 [Amanita phalloides]|nr:hypothetical protein APHAL10511_008200 [Amanita phalloides]
MSLSSLALTAWPVPPLGLALDLDTVPFSDLFAPDLLPPERVLKRKKSDLSIKTYVLEDTVAQSASFHLATHPSLTTHLQSILPTIAEMDDQSSQIDITEPFGSDQHHLDQPFQVDLDSCLLTLIIRSGTPKPETTLLYAAQLVASINSLHTAGIIHGLVSPETVAIRDENYLVLCDCEHRTRTPSPNSPPLRDHDHQRLYLYIAPEIILGWAHGFAVDSWGFGVVLYYMLIGFHPFGDRDGQEDRIINAKSHALRYLHLLDKDAQDLVSKCLERNPALRPSIAEIKDHPYFIEIDWSKMITRYVRVSVNENKAEHRASRQASMLFPANSPCKSLADIDLAVANLGLILEAPNDEKPYADLPSETIESPSMPPSTAKSEWFLSNVDVLDEAGPSTSTPTEGELHSQEQPQMEVSHLAGDDKDQRMKLFWDMLDAEQDTQTISVPASELANTLTYFTSRPRRACRRRSSASPSPHLSLWRSSIEVSSARLNKLEQEKSTNKPQPIQEQLEYEDFNFPPGVEKIGNGIGYTYALPAASRSKLSICSSVPRSCHGMFGHSPKFSLGLGLGQMTSRWSKANIISKHAGAVPFSGNTTTVIYASTRPTLTNAIPTNVLDSPGQDSDAGDTDDSGPLTPDTAVFERKPDKDETKETPTLRLIMVLHHSKHHQAYINALNKAEQQYVQAPTVKERIALQAALKFNGGGHINHSSFWKILAPPKQSGGAGGDWSKAPHLHAAIKEQFKDVDQFIGQFNSTTAAVQGSGWGWLGYDRQTKKLEILTTSNQDPLLTHDPIIGIDVWEHAYYIQYYNVRPDYLKAIWNVVNFEEAERRYLEATKGSKL